MGPRNALVVNVARLLASLHGLRLRSMPHPPSDLWRAAMPIKLLRVKTAAVAGLVLLSIGGVAAAATGLAPTAAERAATRAAPRTPDGQVGHAHGDAATLIHGSNAAAATNSSAPGKPSDHAAGPDASGAAKHGLCRASSAGQGDENGKRAGSTAFQALAAAAGGADRIPAYCQADADGSATHGQRPAAPPSSRPAQSPGNGHGHGHGQNGRPTTT
jgi:hypothetical protein